MRPDFYTPERVGTLYVPNTSAAVNVGQNANLASSEDDKHRVFLLLIDAQVDFIHPDGALSVPGAVEDTKRTVEWIYNHASEITTIGASLDSHIPIQIFSPTWWANQDGRHPEPFTVITAEEVGKGVWQPLYEQEWSKAYVQKLETNAKKLLMIWPYHALIGTPGHTLVPALYEAIAFHSAARKSQPEFLTKGTIARTENYSIFEPEIKVSDRDVNTAYMDKLKSYDLIYVAGQAKSHCVLETVSSMMRHYPPEIVKKMRLLTDAMSSVAHPEIDFDAMADEQFAKFADDGLTLVKTADNIG